MGARLQSERAGDWLVMHEGWRSDIPDELTVGTTLIRVAVPRACATVSPGPCARWMRRTCWRSWAKGVGGTKYGLKLSVQPTSAGSKFAVTIELGGPPLFGPIGSVAARTVKGDIERSVEKFETLYT